MNKLDVHYCGWGEDYHLGTLERRGDDIVFGYTEQARARGIEVAPLALPLAQPGLIRRTPQDSLPIPDFIYDALPDGWGVIIQNQALKAQSIPLANISVLDRLALVGHSAFGALRFVPDLGGDDVEQNRTIVDIANEVKKIVAGEPSEMLPLLLQISSPQGLRPKAAVWFKPDEHRMSTGPFPGAEPWLVKFPRSTEPPEVCAIEMTYALAARQAGIEMMNSTFFQLEDAGTTAFATARFDRSAGLRVPIQTFSAMMEAPKRRVDYRNYMGALRAVSGDQREIDKLFRICVFNVIFNNRDDHQKNISLRMERDGRWVMAPAYDLTYSEGLYGAHQSLVAGNGDAPGRADLIQVARAGGISKPDALHIIDEVLQTTFSWARVASHYPIRRETIRDIKTEIAKNVGQCRAITVKIKPPGSGQRPSKEDDSETFGSS